MMLPAMPEVEREKTVNPSAVSDAEPMSDGINVLELLIVIAQNKWWIAKVTLAATVVAAVVAFVIPSRYTATTKILPPQQNQSLAAALSGQLAAMGPLAAVAGKDLGLKNPNELYVGMLKSRTVEDAIIQRFELMKVYRDSRMSDAREDLEKAAAISVGKEGFISISVEDKSRSRAANMANAYVSELQKLTKSVAVTEAGQRRLFFEQQVNQASENLAAAEQAMKETQQQTGVIQIDAQARAIIESVVRLRAQIAAKEVQLQAMRSFATEQNPNLVVTTQELAGMRAQLAKLERQQNGGGGDVQIPTGQVPQAGLEYIRRLRNVKYYESIFELLAKQHELAKLDEARQGAVIQVIDQAVEPDRKSSPKRGLIIAVVAVLALLGAAFWTLVLESLRRLKEQQPEQLERLSVLKQLLTSRTR